MTIEIQDEYLSDLLIGPAASHSLNNLVAYVEELLSLGAIVRIVRNDAILASFTSAGQFDEHVSKIMACPEKSPDAERNSTATRV